MSDYKLLPKNNTCVSVIQPNNHSPATMASSIKRTSGPRPFRSVDGLISHLKEFNRSPFCAIPLNSLPDSLVQKISLISWCVSHVAHPRRLRSDCARLCGLEATISLHSSLTNAIPACRCFSMSSTSSQETASGSREGSTLAAQVLTKLSMPTWT